MSVFTKVMIFFGSFLIVFYLPPILYFKQGWFHRFYHNIMGWHQPDDSLKYSDGCSTHARCRYCGKDIMQDSQGNWF